METLLLRVEGMTSAASVRAVTHALMSVPGIQAAAVNFRDGTATVEGTRLARSLPALLAALAAAGFEGSADATAPPWPRVLRTGTAADDAPPPRFTGEPWGLDALPPVGELEEVRRARESTAVLLRRIQERARSSAGPA